MGGTFNCKNGHCPENGRRQCIGTVGHIIKFSSKIFIMLFAIFLSTGVVSAATTTYYFKNNATSTNLGFDGTTNYSTSGTIITVIPYKQVYTTSTAGTAGNIGYTTSSGTTVYNVYRFYPIPNVTTYTQIGANITGRLSYFAVTSSDRVNVSIWDYNPADGSKIKYGESTNKTNEEGPNNYNFQINNPAFNVLPGHKVIAYVNVTTPSPGTIKLYFGGSASYIVLSETPIPFAITGNGNNVTNNNSLSLSVNQNTTVQFNLTANLTIDSMIITKGSNVTLLSNDTLGKITMWGNFTFPNYGTMFVNMTVFNTTNSASKNWTITVNDVIPPNQVTNLTNTTIPTKNEINLGWDVGTDNTGGSGIKDYFLQKSNDSINWLTVERPTINATGIDPGYEDDAYWYTFRNPVPINCLICHPSPGIPALTNPQASIGNYWMKFNGSYLYVAAMLPDNDTDNNDDLIELVFDVAKDGGTAPKSDDKLYELHEDGTNETKVGDGTGWVDFASNLIGFTNRTVNTTYSVTALV
jgi:hypothetical protein